MPNLSYPCKTDVSAVHGEFVEELPDEHEVGTEEYPFVGVVWLVYWVTKGGVNWVAYHKYAQSQGC